MKISKVFLGLTAAALLATGCAQQRAPATKALNAVEESLSQIKDDAAKYAPDGLKGVESQLARLKESLDKKEYENVLAGTPELTKAVDSLKDAVASGKEHAHAAMVAAKTQWDGLNTEVPKMVDDIQVRIDELSKHKLHIKVTKDELESAKSGLAWMKSEWADAAAAAKAGKTTAAAEKAQAVKDKAVEVRKTLDMKQA